MKPALSIVRRGRSLAVATVLLSTIAVASGGAGAAPQVNVAPGVDDSEIVSAKLGVSLYALDDLAGTATPGVCPVLTLDEVTYVLGASGMTATTIGYEVGAYAGDDPDTLTVFCGVDPESFVESADPAAPFALRMYASTLDAGDGTFQQYLDAVVSGMVPAPVADPAVGGESATRCGTPGRRVCFAAWHRDGFVLDYLIVGPPEQLDDLTANQLLLSMVPLAVTNLANYSTAPAATTLPPVTAPPVTAAPVTVAPVTVAPVTVAPVTVAPVTAPSVTAPPATAVPVPTPPVTAAPTPPATTIAPPATTVDGTPLSSEQQAVLRGALDANAVALVAGAVPSDAGLPAAIDATFVVGGPAHDEVTAAMAAALADGTTAMPSADVAPSFSVESVTLTGSPADSAVLVACAVESLVVTDSTGALVSNDLVARRVELTMQLDAGVWKVFQRTVLAETPDATECAADPAIADAAPTSTTVALDAATVTA